MGAIIDHMWAATEAIKYHSIAELSLFDMCAGILVFVIVGVAAYLISRSVLGE